MAASAVEPRGVVAVYFWGCRPQPPPRPPWVTLSPRPLFSSPPAARRASLPRRRRHRRLPPRYPDLVGELVFPSGGEKSPCFSLSTLFLSLSRRRRAHNLLSQDRRSRRYSRRWRPADYTNLALSSGLRRRCAGRRGTRGMFRGRWTSGDESRRRVSPRRIIAARDRHYEVKLMIVIVHNPQVTLSRGTDRTQRDAWCWNYFTLPFNDDFNIRKKYFCPTRTAFEFAKLFFSLYFIHLVFKVLRFYFKRHVFVLHFLNKTIYTLSLINTKVINDFDIDVTI